MRKRTSRFFSFLKAGSAQETMSDTIRPIASPREIMILFGSKAYIISATPPGISGGAKEAEV
ncbi:MAG: hypothetical protein C0394_01740 [Syntrophus sp. (in: bacteria)]|nr:hypothetical protein [Syntrophus sp. (in: bacteria)]